MGPQLFSGCCQIFDVFSCFRCSHDQGHRRLMGYVGLLGLVGLVILVGLVELVGLVCPMSLRV